MPNLITQCQHCDNRTTFSLQRKDDTNKKLSTHSAMFFNSNGNPIKKRRVLQTYSKYDYFHYVYCDNCTKRRKDLYYSGIHNQIRQFNFPKKAFSYEDFEMYDAYHEYQYRNDRIEMARKFGCQYISEATARIYEKTKSVYHTGKALKLSSYSIRSELNMMGIKRNGPGGWNKGTDMGGRFNPDTKERYLKLINERLAK